MRTVYLILGLLMQGVSSGQPVQARLASAMKALEADSQFRHATISMYVVDSKTGSVVFAKNEQTGMAPASCQKVLTSATAFALLGKDFRYVTYIGKDYPMDTAYDAGCLFIRGSGDPTLGSWRWPGTTDSAVYKKIASALKVNKLSSFSENLVIEDYLYGVNPLPGGWIWEDVGNYYGAACFGFNWHENQFDLLLQPGSAVGTEATVVTMKPFLHDVSLFNTITTGKPGSGDNGYIYSTPYSNRMLTEGTVPLQKEIFTISGSIPNPASAFKAGLLDYLNRNNIRFKGNAISGNEAMLSHTTVHRATHFIDSVFSPTLDSMNYWFLKKSINLYGEAFLKSLWVKKLGFGTAENNYEEAIETLKDFWAINGIERSALHISDGSGLSPANRLTTHALVTVLQYAKKQNWFASFYLALPEMNGIKMKDGYIGGVRSYTGFIKSKSGTEYSFSFIVNNFDGSASAVRTKMWKVLDLLK